MQIVAGIGLKNLKPRVWDPTSPYYLPGLKAVMISYGDFGKMAAQRRRAMESGLHTFLGIPEDVKIFLDNGAFYFLRRTGETPRGDYEAFVAAARPDWCPIPQDFIPIATMTLAQQQRCFEKTMEMNLAYQHDGFISSPAEYPLWHPRGPLMDWPRCHG